MIVADANLIVFFAIRDARSQEADAVLEADPVWVAPLLWRSEFRNVLAKFMRRAGMSMETAVMALGLAEDAIGGREYNVASEMVLELAARSKCTAYDCEYVALAMDLDAPLVTADEQVVRAFPKIAVPMEAFVK